MNREQMEVLVMKAIREQRPDLVDYLTELTSQMIVIMETTCGLNKSPDEITLLVRQTYGG